MKPTLRTLLIVSATAAATAAATTVLPIGAGHPAATSAATAPAAVTATAAEAVNPPGAPLVTGLPDFTQLVERVGPAVVSIEARGSARRAAMPQGGMPDEEDMPEFFRRFFGPDMPMPGGPQGPRDPGEDGPQAMSIGTGFLISGDGYLLTNHHVVDGADEVNVTLSDRREFKAKVIGSDPQSDVAVLKISAADLPYLRTGDSKTLKPGQWVVAIGSPFGLDHSVTAGIVSAVGRAANAQQRYVPFIQTDVAINRGNSGGPLLNTRGEVVGINSQIFSNSGGYMGVSFAIPMDVAMNVAQQIRTTGKVSRGQIGVVVGAVDSDTAKGFGLPDTRGALVSDVRAGSPAEKAGIEPGDVIRAVDGIAIDDSSDLPPVVGAMAPGSTAKLTILRGGKTLERNVTLSRLDEEQVAGAPRRGAPDRDEPATGKGNALGLIGQDIAPDERRELGLRSGEGVVIARIEGRAARSAGLRPGDIVLRVGTQPIPNAAALDRALARVGDDQTVMLLVRRGNATQFLAVTPDDKG
ncbi:MAG: DegQ family serine endoprotease [Pseudomonadota bacterium]